MNERSVRWTSWSLNVGGKRVVEIRRENENLNQSQGDELKRGTTRNSNIRYQELPIPQELFPAARTVAIVSAIRAQAILAHKEVEFEAVDFAENAGPSVEDAVNQLKQERNGRRLVSPWKLVKFTEQAHTLAGVKLDPQRRQAIKVAVEIVLGEDINEKVKI